MNASDVVTLVNRTVKPKAPLSSLLMCVTFLAKNDLQAVDIYMKAVCDSDIYKGALITRRLSGELGEKCRQIVCRTLSERCEEPQRLTEAELLAMLELDEQSLFYRVRDALSEELVQRAFSQASGTAACRMMELFFPADCTALYPAAERLFCDFLDHYDSSGDEALTSLLPVLLEHNASVPLSKLIATVGPQRLEELYGPSLWDELDRLIVLGYDSPEIWDAYCQRLFSRSRSMEELLVQGLWHIQLFARDCDEAAAVFYLYAIKHLGTEHEIFEHINCVEIPESFTRKHTLMYHDILHSLWEDPGQLARFLSKTEPCNPFARVLLPEDSFSLLPDGDTKDRQYFELLDRMCAWDLEPGTILTVFFQSDLKYHLPLEDLLDLAQRYQRLDRIMEALSRYTFSGEIVRFMQGSVILNSRSYHVRSLHSVRIHYAQAEQFFSGKQELIGTTVQYWIVGFHNGQILAELVPQASQQDRKLGEPKKWNKLLTKLHAYCAHPGQRLQDHPNLSTVLSFPVEEFAEKNDFGLMTALISSYPERINQFLKLFQSARWNVIAQQPDLHIPGYLFTQLSKYQEDAETMFRKLFSWGLPYKKILALYFETLYKMIVPLDRLLVMGKRENMLKELPAIPICVKLGEGADRACCRLSNICSPRICYVDHPERFVDHAVIRTRCVDFSIFANAVVMIRLEAEAAQILPGSERGALFGYLANNIQISTVKRDRITQLPSVEHYTKRELIFVLRCMEDAFVLRRASAAAMLELLRTMGTKNPFLLSLDARSRVGATYLLNLYSAERKQRISNTMVSVILNAGCIEDIGEIYANTSIKYSLTIEELVAMILARRPEFARRLPDLFARVTFCLTADPAGGVWSPYFRQGSVTVSGNCRDSYLVCRVRPEPDGIGNMEILSVEKGSEMVFPVALSLLSGYQLGGSSTAFVQSLLERNNALSHLLPQERSAVLQDPVDLAHLLIKSVVEHFASDQSGF